MDKEERVKLCKLTTSNTIYGRMLRVFFGRLAGGRARSWSNLSRRSLAFPVLAEAAQRQQKQPQIEAVVSTANKNAIDCSACGRPISCIFTRGRRL